MSVPSPAGVAVDLVLGLRRFQCPENALADERCSRQAVVVGDFIDPIHQRGRETEENCIVVFWAVSLTVELLPGYPLPRSPPLYIGFGVLPGFLPYLFRDLFGQHGFVFFVPDGVNVHLALYFVLELLKSVHRYVLLGNRMIAIDM